MLRAPSHGKSSSPLAARLRSEHPAREAKSPNFFCFVLLCFGYVTLIDGPVKLLPGLSINISGARWLFVARARQMEEQIVLTSKCDF